VKRQRPGGAVSYSLPSPNMAGASADAFDAAHDLEAAQTAEGFADGER